MASKNKLQVAASDREKLLRLINETEHAAPDLTKCKLHVAELRNQVYDASQNSSTLHEIAQKEKKDFEDCQKSRLKRLGYLLGGQKRKLDVRIEKEEQEYLEAESKYNMGKARWDELERLFDESKKERDKLEALVKKHIEYQNQLDSLLDSAFDGPTPEFPKDDELEAKVKEAQRVYHEAQQRLYAESQLHSAVNQALSCFISAVSYMDNAIAAAQRDIAPTDRMYFNASRNPFLDPHRLAERDVDQALTSAQNSVAEGTTKANAIFASLGVPGIMPPNIPERDILWNVVLDSTLTDVVFWDKLNQVREEVNDVAITMQGHARVYEERVEACRNETEAPQQELEARRKELFELRASFLENLVSTKGGLDVKV